MCVIVLEQSAKMSQYLFEMPNDLVDRIDSISEIQVRQSSLFNLANVYDNNER